MTAIDALLAGIDGLDLAVALLLLVALVIIWPKRPHRHEPVRGSNGWENFGTGYFCRCGAMVDIRGRRVDP